MPAAEYEYNDARGPFYRQSYVGALRMDNPRATIGVIDDGVDSIESIQHYLATRGFASFGFHINRARHLIGAQVNTAAEMIAQTDVQLVICDKNIGATSGIDLTTALTDHVPTILLTGEVETRETHRVGTAFMEKPIDPKSLLATIQGLLGM